MLLRYGNPPPLFARQGDLPRNHAAEEVRAITPEGTRTTGRGNAVLDDAEEVRAITHEGAKTSQQKARGRKAAFATATSEAEAEK